MTPITITVDQIDGIGMMPRIGDDIVVRRPSRFFPRTNLNLWQRSSSVTLRVVSVTPLRAKPVKLTRSWKNIVTGEFMQRERVLP